MYCTESGFVAGWGYDMSEIGERDHAVLVLKRMVNCSGFLMSRR